MPRYAAVLDACVLVPVALADTLLRIAEKGLYRPLWSGRILTEARHAITAICSQHNAVMAATAGAHIEPYACGKFTGADIKRPTTVRPASAPSTARPPSISNPARQ